MHSSPAHKMKLCMAHAIQYKIRYVLKLVCILNQEESLKLMLQSKAKEELVLLQRNEYARMMDAE